MAKGCKEKVYNQRGDFTEYNQGCCTKNSVTHAPRMYYTTETYSRLRRLFQFPVCLSVCLCIWKLIKFWLLISQFHFASHLLFSKKFKFSTPDMTDWRCKDSEELFFIRPVHSSSVTSPLYIKAPIYKSIQLSNWTSAVNCQCGPCLRHQSCRSPIPSCCCFSDWATASCLGE